MCSRHGICGLRAPQVRQVDLPTGDSLISTENSDEIFGEGLTVLEAEGRPAQVDGCWLFDAYVLCDGVLTVWDYILCDAVLTVWGCVLTVCGYILCDAVLTVCCAVSCSNSPGKTAKYSSIACRSSLSNGP